MDTFICFPKVALTRRKNSIWSGRFILHKKPMVRPTEKSLCHCSSATTMCNDNKQRKEVTMAGKLVLICSRRREAKCMKTTRKKNNITTLICWEMFIFQANASPVRVGQTLTKHTIVLLERKTFGSTEEPRTDLYKGALKKTNWCTSVLLVSCKNVYLS